MNASMDQIRERNLDISEYSESTQVGVKSLKTSMREVAESLSQFKIVEPTGDEPASASIDMLKQPAAGLLLDEEEMQAIDDLQESKAS